MNLVWTNSFIKSLKKLISKNPLLRSKIELTLKKLSSNPHDPMLKTHNLKGEFQKCKSCTVDYNCRIIFEIQSDDKQIEEIFLIDIGSHDEVY
jgi:mRNA interferase YafQ